MKLLKPASPRQPPLSKNSKLPALIIIVLLWATLAGLIVFVRPSTVKDFIFEDSYAIFFILIFSAVFMTSAWTLSSTRKGLLVSGVVTSFLILRYVGVGNIFNGAILALIAIALELFFRAGHSKPVNS